MTLAVQCRESTHTVYSWKRSTGGTGRGKKHVSDWKGWTHVGQWQVSPARRGVSWEEGARRQAVVVQKTGDDHHHHHHHHHDHQDLDELQLGCGGDTEETKMAVSFYSGNSWNAMTSQWHHRGGGVSNLWAKVRTSCPPTAWSSHSKMLEYPFNRTLSQSKTLMINTFSGQRWWVLNIPANKNISAKICGVFFIFITLFL